MLQLLPALFLFLAAPCLFSEQLPLDGSVDLSEEAAALKKTRKGGDLSAPQLLRAFQVHELYGDVREAIACAEAFLKTQPESAELQATTHLSLCRLYALRLADSKALRHGNLALKLLKELPAAENQESLYKAHATLGAVLWNDYSKREANRKHWQQAQTIAKELAGEEEALWTVRQAHAEAWLIRIRAYRFGGYDIKTEELEGMEAAELLLTDIPEKWFTANQEASVLRAEIPGMHASVRDRHHTKSKMIEPSPSDLYEDSLDHWTKLEESYPHHQAIHFAHAYWRGKYDEEVDQFTSEKGTNLEEVESTLKQFTRITERDPGHLEAAFQAQRCQRRLGEELAEAKDYEESTVVIDEAVAKLEKILSEKSPGERLHRRLYVLARLHRARAYTTNNNGEPEESAVHYRKAVEIAGEAMLAAPQNLYLSDWIDTTTAYGIGKISSEHPEGRVELNQVEIDIREKVHAKAGKYKRTQFYYDLADNYDDLALLLEQMDPEGNRQRLLEIYQKQIDYGLLGIGENSSWSSSHTEVLHGYHDLALSLALTAKTTEDLTPALELLQKADRFAREECHDNSTARKASKAFQDLLSQYRRTQAGVLPASP